MFMYQKCSCTTKPITKGDDNRYVRAARLMKVLSSPNRAQLLSVLHDGPHCVTDLQKHTSLSQTLVSHHMIEFVRLGLVTKKKDSRFVEYSLTPRGQRLTQALNYCIESPKPTRVVTKAPVKKSIFERLFGSQ